MADEELSDDKVSASLELEASMTSPGMRLDGSIIDPAQTEQDEPTNLDAMANEDGPADIGHNDGTARDITGMANIDGTFPVNLDGTFHHASEDGATVDGNNMEEEVEQIADEEVEDVAMEVPVEEMQGLNEEGEDQVVEEEPSSPLSDNTGSSRSGCITPASQSDQSVTTGSTVRPSTTAGGQADVDKVKGTPISGKKGQPINSGIHWRKGEKLEAMDYLDSWFPAKIREVNDVEQKVLIHFDGWNQRFDEWIDMNSDRIRPLARSGQRGGKSKKAKGQQCPMVLQSFKIGDQVYAKWTDCKMYPAKITNKLPNGSYEVIFYDGFKKLVQPINLRHMPNEHKQFDIEPVPDVVLKKAKMKLDTTPEIPDERGRSRSIEKLSSSGDKERRRMKRKRQATFDGADLASIVNSLEKSPAELTGLPIKSEPVSTQTDYMEKGSTGGETMSLAGPAVAQGGLLPPKAFVVQSDHNPYKCPFDGCNKGFRKEHLLDYHIKYYHHMVASGEGAATVPPQKKKRRKTTSTCSTESESGSRKSGSKKNRNLSAEASLCQVAVKLEAIDPAVESGESCLSPTIVGKPGVESYNWDEAGASSTSTPGIKCEEDSSIEDAEDFLKPDELVNCICDFQEENGLMIQCEVCMCWQHAACFGITERTLPKMYVCFVCENPPGVRESSKYVHEQEWWKTGEMSQFSFLSVPGPSEETCNTVKTTHTLMAEIHQLNTVMHSLKLQLLILRNKDEAKLKHWKIDWDVIEQETMETCPEIVDQPDKGDHSQSTTAKGDDPSNSTKRGHSESTVLKIGKEKADNCEGVVEPNDKHTMPEGSIVPTLDKAQEGQAKQESPSEDRQGVESIGVTSGVGESEALNCNRGGALQGNQGTSGVKKLLDADSETIVHSENKTPANIESKHNADQSSVEKKQSAEGSLESGNQSDVSKLVKGNQSNSENRESNSQSGLRTQEFVKQTEISFTDAPVNNQSAEQFETGNQSAEQGDTGNQSDSTESVLEEPGEVCERNLINHILRVQADIADRLDKINEEITMLEAMEACQARKTPVEPQRILDDMPHLKRSMRLHVNDLTRVRKMAVFH